MTLESFGVKKARQTDVYRDLARIPEMYRRDALGRRIREGTICKVTASPDQGSVILSLRGLIGETECIIRMDEITRIQLGVVAGSAYHFEFTPVGYWGITKWRWNASDQAQRMTNRMAIVAFGIAIVGAMITIGRLISDVLGYLQGTAN